jgi:hypothetical protein
MFQLAARNVPMGGLLRPAPAGRSSPRVLAKAKQKGSKQQGSKVKVCNYCLATSLAA